MKMANQGIMHAAGAWGGLPLCRTRRAHMSKPVELFRTDVCQCKRCAAIVAKMTKRKHTKLIAHLIDAGQELFADHDLGFPQTCDGFMCAMWQNDMDMKTWDATREEYTEALSEAYEALSCKMTKANHTLIIDSASNLPAEVIEARAHGLEVSYRDTKLHCGKSSWTERHWTVFCTEEEFERFIEWGQP